jgi:hypothetical protein
MKKYFLLGIFSLMSIVSLFAQKSERITYQELRPDGGLKDVTVNAVLLGWEQQWHYFDDDFKVIMSSSRPYNGEWSNWELSSRAPARLPNIPRLSNMRLRSDYDERALVLSKYPRYGWKYYYNGLEILKMAAIPNGGSSPIWWSEDGRSYYIFYRLYDIIP